MKILLVSNMYPSKEFPAYGIFVKNFVEICEENHVLVDKIVLYKSTNTINKLLNYLLYYFKIIFAVLFKQYDWVYVHYAGQNSLPFYLLTRIKKFPLIFNVHGSDVIAEKKVHQILAWFTKKVLIKCQKVVVPSEYYKHIVEATFQVNPNYIDVFPSSGINETIFYPRDKQATREELGLPKTGKQIIGYVGRIEYGKGWDVLLQSIKLLNDQEAIHPNSHQFIFIGEGKELRSFLDMVKDLNLNDYVRQINAIPQQSLVHYYNSFDLFCFPTKRKSESLGLVGIEALACGVPVIASDYAAPKYYIENGYNGFKFQVDSPTELAKSINLYLHLSEEEKKQMSKNSVDSSVPYQKNSIASTLINEVLNRQVIVEQNRG